MLIQWDTQKYGKGTLVMFRGALEGKIAIVPYQLICFV